MHVVGMSFSALDALFASGEPLVQGSRRHLQLRRGSMVVIDFDLYDLLIRDDKSKDVIFIPQAAVNGSVRNPAIYQLQTNETLAGFSPMLEVFPL